jgi:hypothetical protein
MNKRYLKYFLIFNHFKRTQIKMLLKTPNDSLQTLRFASIYENLFI